MQPALLDEPPSIQKGSGDPVWPKTGPNSTKTQIYICLPDFSMEFQVKMYFKVEIQNYTLKSLLVFFSGIIKFFTIV